MKDAPARDGTTDPVAGAERLGVDGTWLHLRRWRPPAGSPPRAPVIVVHGFGEHAGRHEVVAAALAASGREVWAIDQRGHGRSPGPRAYVGCLDRALADLDALVDAALAHAALADAGDGGSPGRRALPAGAGPVLFGHSMGGAFVAAYAVSRPGRAGALVLSAPALHLPGLPASRVVPARFLARFVPHVRVARVAPAALSRDAAAVREFVADPLVWHGRVPAATAWAMYEAGTRALAGAGALEVPVLVVHGAADAVVPIASSRRFLGALGSADTELVEIAHGAHEPLHDLGSEDVTKRVVDWVAAH